MEWIQIWVPSLNTLTATGLMVQNLCRSQAINEIGPTGHTFLASKLDELN